MQITPNDAMSDRAGMIYPNPKLRFIRLFTILPRMTIPHPRLITLPPIHSHSNPFTCVCQQWFICRIGFGIVGNHYTILVKCDSVELKYHYCNHPAWIPAILFLIDYSHIPFYPL